MSPHSQFSTIHGPSRHWIRTLLPKCSAYSGKTQMTLWPLHVPSLHTLPLGRPQDEATGHLCNCSVTPRSHPPSRRSRSSLPDFWKRVNFGCPFPRAGLTVLRSLFAPPLLLCHRCRRRATTFSPLLFLLPLVLLSVATAPPEALFSSSPPRPFFQHLQNSSSEAERGCFLPIASFLHSQNGHLDLEQDTRPLGRKRVGVDAIAGLNQWWCGLTHVPVRYFNISRHLGVLRYSSRWLRRPMMVPPPSQVTEKFRVWCHSSFDQCGWTDRQSPILFLERSSKPRVAYEGKEKACS